VKLAQLLVPKYEKVKEDEYDGTVDLVEKIAFGDGQIYFRDERKTGMDLYLAEAGDLITSKINIHQGAVALAPRRLAASTHYQVYAVNSLDVVPEYLVHVMRTPEFISQLVDLKNKGIKNEQGASFLLEFQIPLPPPDIQGQIAADLCRAQQVITGAEALLANWSVDRFLVEGATLHRFSDLASVDAQIVKHPQRDHGDRLYVGGENIESGTARLVSRTTVNDAGIFGPSYSFTAGQVLYSKVRPGLRKVVLAEEDGLCSSDIYPLTVNIKVVDPQYLAICLASQKFAQETAKFHERAGMPKINRDQLSSIALPIPPLARQRELVEQCHSEIIVLQGLRSIMSSTQDQTRKRLSQVWDKG
jgi:restriction endonuclease S subunit